MGILEAALGIDSADPETVRAVALAKGDRKFLRNLVALRRSSGMSQQDVADKLGIKQSSVAAFERYDNDPKLSTIRRYAQVVGALVAHRVQADQGQLENCPSGVWDGGWTSVGPSVVNPTVSVQSANPQVSFSAEDFSKRGFALAA